MVKVMTSPTEPEVSGGAENLNSWRNYSRTTGVGDSTQRGSLQCVCVSTT